MESMRGSILDWACCADDETRATEAHTIARNEIFIECMNLF
jgi:hypothetical protein